MGENPKDFIIMLDKHLDWLQWTFEGGQPAKNALPKHVSMLPKQSDKPLFGVYEKCIRLANDGLIMWSEKNERVGIHVLLSGNCLRISRDLGLTDERLLQHVLYAKNVSRLDFAVTTDLFGMDEFMAKKDENLGRLNLDSTIIDEKNGGQSVYFGSRKSDRRIIVYDKAKELGLLSEALSRVELRLRNRYASKFAQNALLIPFRQLGSNMIHDSLRFANFGGFTNAISNDPDISFSALPKREDSFDAWIDDQIKPAFQKKVFERRASVEAFLEWLSALLES
jgi:hypothetical protein